MKVILPIISLAFLAASCASAPPVPKDNFFRISAPAAKTKNIKNLNGTLEIAEFKADGIISERAMAYTDDGQKLNQYSYNYWLQQPGRILQNVLADYFRSTNAAPLVVTTNARITPDYLLTGEIRRFEHQKSPSNAVIEVIFTLTRTRDGKILLLEKLNAEEKCSSSPEAFASAMQKAVEKIIAQLAEKI